MRRGSMHGVWKGTGRLEIPVQCPHSTYVSMWEIAHSKLDVIKISNDDIFILLIFVR